MNLHRLRKSADDFAGRFTGPICLFLVIGMLGFICWKGFLQEVWTDWVIRPKLVATERAAENALFEKQFARDPFFVALPVGRQGAIRKTVLETLRWNRFDAVIDKFNPKDLAYQDLGSGLTLDEANWFRSKGLIGEPRWPGYKTYRTPEGIFVLFPDRIGEELQAEKENAR